jgi:hypothetical protein
MKLTPLAHATLLAFALVIAPSPLHADPSAGTGYSLTSTYTDPASNLITGFAWDSSNNLYYETGTTDYGFVGVYQANFASPASPTTITTTGTYAGSSVTYQGGYLFFNDGNNNIYSYNTAGGSSPSLVANIPNYSLATSSGTLYMSGGLPDYTHQIALSGLSGGTLLNTSGLAIETDGNYPGPLSFDSAGNLYYAPGGGTDTGANTIYKWTAAQVATAGTTPLVADSGSTWLDYSLQFSSYTGATGMTVDNNQLVLTLSSFGNPSALIGVDINSDGTAGSAATLATDTTLGSAFLSQVQVNNGNLYVADGSQIYEVLAIPEPSTFALLALGLSAMIGFHLRRSRRLASRAVLMASSFFFR